ncbi:MAG: TIGR00725 family protein [Actinomycetota bacterium]|nr:TIGR00725 family protein [Actinomycetota bacterium]
MYVAIVGSANASDAVAALAEEVGALVAKSGATLVCGGLTGVMEAACRGAKSEGGTTVGILPGTRRSDANDYVDIALPTGLGEARNALVVRAADAVIAVAGEFGTLSEIGLALKMATPVVGLGTWELLKGAERVDAIRPATTPAQAVALALDLSGRA